MECRAPQSIREQVKEGQARRPSRNAAWAELGDGEKSPRAEAGCAVEESYEKGSLTVIH